MPNIPVTNLLKALGCTVVSLALLLACVLIAGRATPLELGAILLAPPAALGIIAILLRRRDKADPRAEGHTWRLVAGVVFRYLDVLVWTGRYGLTFWVIGQQVSAMQTATLTVASQAAMITPVQLGLREWIVGGVLGRTGQVQAQRQSLHVLRTDLRVIPATLRLQREAAAEGVLA